VIKPSLITEAAVVPPPGVVPPLAADELGELLLQAATPALTRATAVAIAITVLLFLIVMVSSPIPVDECAI
jgi:hypothetical protein